MMPKITRTTLIAAFIGFASVVSVSAETTASLFNPNEAESIRKYPSLNFGPLSYRFKYDKRMIRAAEIAKARARAHSTSRCWRYVKDALVSAQVLDSRPTTALAKQAANELLTKYGFAEVKIRDPYKAPIGSVIVYGGRGAGHVEIRTKEGFVSDFVSATPSKRPLIGVFVKPS